jgi:hypothetical protein
MHVSEVLVLVGCATGVAAVALATVRIRKLRSKVRAAGKVGCQGEKQLVATMSVPGFVWMVGSALLGLGIAADSPEATFGEYGLGGLFYAIGAGALWVVLTLGELVRLNAIASRKRRSGSAEKTNPPSGGSS